GLMLVSGADFRSGMILSVLAFAVASAALILVAARVRGRIAASDAFFPLLLLHWGHAENFLHSFQIAFTPPIAPAALLAGALGGCRPGPGGLVAAAVALGAAALPLCSVVGLALTPPVVLWLAWSAYDAVRDRRGGAAAGILVAGATVAAIATVLLLVSFPRP